MHSNAAAGQLQILTSWQEIIQSSMSQQKHMRQDMLLAVSNHDDDMQQTNLCADVTRDPIMEHAK